MFQNLLADHSEDIACAENLVFLVIIFDFGSPVFAGENDIADLDVEGDLVAFVVKLACSEGDDNGFQRFLLG